MGKKLLLADDSITIQKVVGIIFANEDYELTVVDNGNAALDKARELLPDIIMVDALMPGKTGYEVCEAVRREPHDVGAAGEPRRVPPHLVDPGRHRLVHEPGYEPAQQVVHRHVHAGRRG